MKKNRDLKMESDLDNLLGSLMYIFLYIPLNIFVSPYVFMIVWNWTLPHTGMMSLSYPVAFIMMMLLKLTRFDPDSDIREYNKGGVDFQKNVLANTIYLTLYCLVYWNLVLFAGYVARSYLE